MMIRRAHRGISLIEVLAALVLVGIVVPVAMEGINASLRAAARARHLSEAAQLAQLKIAEYLVVRDATLFGGSGSFGDAWPEYSWEVTNESGPMNTYLVTLNVYWLERGQQQSYRISTLVYPDSTSSGSSIIGGGL